MPLFITANLSKNRTKIQKDSRPKITAICDHVCNILQDGRYLID